MDVWERSVGANAETRLELNSMEPKETHVLCVGERDQMVWVFGPIYTGSQIQPETDLCHLQIAIRFAQMSHVTI